MWLDPGELEVFNRFLEREAHLARALADPPRIVCHAAGGTVLLLLVPAGMPRIAEVSAGDAN